MYNDTHKPYYTIYIYNTCVYVIYFVLNASYKVVPAQVDPNYCAVPFFFKPRRRQLVLVLLSHLFLVDIALLHVCEWRGVR